MKQSAVEWLIEQWPVLESQIPERILNQAKEMEKQQIENAYWDGGQDIPLTEKRCEQYYNETFKKQ
jgi:HEPN domain-containing protein